MRVLASRRCSPTDRLCATVSLQGSESAACRVDDLEVTVDYDSRPRKGWRGPDFHIEFARVAKPRDGAECRAGRRPASSSPSCTAPQSGARMRSPHRRASTWADAPHVRDSRHRLIRTNHVAFLEGSGDVNQSVSRRHAHISYEPAARCFRLHDDGSEHGTGIVRGRTNPRGSPRRARRPPRVRRRDRSRRRARAGEVRFARHSAADVALNRHALPTLAMCLLGHRMHAGCIDPPVVEIEERADGDRKIDGFVRPTRCAQRVELGRLDARRVVVHLVDESEERLVPVVERG